MTRIISNLRKVNDNVLSATSKMTEGAIGNEAMAGGARLTAKLTKFYRPLGKLRGLL